MNALSKEGTVIAVSLRAESGVPKYPLPKVRIGQYGVEGDFHAGPVNRHKKTGPPEPNLRQLTVVAKEALDAVNERLGTALGPGDLGENLLVEGMGDLSNLKKGDVVLVGNAVALQVTSQNTPCATLSIYHKDIIMAFMGIRGITAVVLAPGMVYPNDPVRLKLG